MYSSRTWITRKFVMFMSCSNDVLNRKLSVKFTVNYYNYSNQVNVVILLLMMIVFAICFVFSDFHHVRDFYRGINGLVSLFYFYTHNTSHINITSKIQKNSSQIKFSIQTHFEALLMSGLKLSRLA